MKTDPELLLKELDDAHEEIEKGLGICLEIVFARLEQQISQSGQKCEDFQ